MSELAHNLGYIYYVSYSGKFRVGIIEGAFVDKWVYYYHGY